MKNLLSKSVLKQSVKNNWKLWAILTGVLCFFVTVVIVVSQTGGGSGGQSDGRGGNPFGNTSLDVILANAFFSASGMAGMMMLILLITFGNKLVASEIDRGTMSFTLNTPTTRKQIIFSKALFYVCALILMVILIGTFASVTSLIVNANMNYGNLWRVIFGLALFGFATSGICFAASCWFNKSGQSLLIGAGVPVAFFLLNSLSGLITISGKEFLKYFSLNTLFDTSAVLGGVVGDFVVQFIAMAVIGVVLYAVGITKFLKKDLPL